MTKDAIKKGGPFALGIHCFHDASAALCSPDGILCSIQEDRLTRIKHHYGVPYRAIEEVMRYCGVTAADISVVAFSGCGTHNPEYLGTKIVTADGATFDYTLLRERGDFDGWDRDREIAAMKKAYAANRWSEFEARHFLYAYEYLVRGGYMARMIPHYHIDHHRCHASCAFRTSSVSSASICTLDGKGDGRSAAIYHGLPDGRMQLIQDSPAAGSVCAFYQAITDALGFVPIDSEYKTMGLAALGNGNGYENPFATVVDVQNGKLNSSCAWTYRSYNRYNPDRAVKNPLSSVAQVEYFKEYLKTYSRENFSFFAQEHFEDVVLAFVRDAMELTGSRNIVAAGGGFLNVKANMLIEQRLEPESFYVFPDAGDAGLAVGAALEALYQEGFIQQHCALGSPYVGNHFDDAKISVVLKEYQQKHELSVMSASINDIAAKLEKGKVIGTFQGRMEMGPRALGNRSVIADPRDVQIKDRINLLLKGREPFVPFAPAFLAEDAPLYWDGHYEYPHMTVAVRASAYAKKNIPAVVHVDGSLRPEVVSREYNEFFYNLLCAFKKKSGVGVLLNTSFNRHGLPIVATPQDALDHLVNGWVDALYLGPWYVERNEEYESYCDEMKTVEKETR